ncbi:MAG: hypothetical protein E7605_04480 [Ruminococcaceae bacterium]|nr:hypothetical protein [Oscillospiraceae bacterium]
MDNKILYGIMTIIFNSIGVPCFMQGKVKAGVLRIVLACITFGVVGVINEIMGIIQGIKILCMSDEDYAAADKATLLMGVPSGK